MNMRQLNAVLAVIQDSERLSFNLMVSINSSSSEKNLIECGLIPYLEQQKRYVKCRIFFLTLKAVWFKVTRGMRSKN